MARLPQLLDALAASDTRRTYASFDAISRVLREAGLIAPTLRGRGATVLNARDAANLLLGTLVPVPAQTEAPGAVVVFRTLRLIPSSTFRMMPSDRHPKASVFAGLGEVQQFGEAVELLIEQAEAMSFALMDWTDAVYSNFPEDCRYALNLPTLTVSIRSNLSAEIALTLNYGTEGVKEFAARYLVDLDQPPEGPFSRSSDTLVTARVGLPTLVRLHTALFAPSAVPTAEEAS